MLVKNVLFKLSLVASVLTISSSSMALLEGEGQDAIDRTLLEQILKTCSTDLLCYRNGIKSILGMEVTVEEVDKVVAEAIADETQIDRVHSDFECFYSSGDGYYMQDSKTGVWIDNYKDSKGSSEDCRVSITLALRNGGYICGNHGVSDKYFIKKIDTGRVDDNYYTPLHRDSPFNSFSSCLQAVRDIRSGHACVPAGRNGFVRVDLTMNNYLDVDAIKKYSDCVSRL